MKKVVLLMGLSFCMPVRPMQLLPSKDQVKNVVFVAVVATATYLALRWAETWFFASEQDQLDAMIKDIVKTMIIQQKVVTHHEIEDAVARVLQGKYPHLTRERLRKVIQQIVAEEIAPIAEQTTSLESKVQRLINGSQIEAVVAQEAAEEAEEPSCCAN